MRYLAMIAALAMVGGCGPPARQREIDRELSDLNSKLSRCNELYIEHNQAQGTAALAEWDKAAAENVDQISRSQEDEIRIALGRELNIAPSQVAWKDIYRRRAELSGKDANYAAARVSGDYYSECRQEFAWRNKVDALEKERAALD